MTILVAYASQNQSTAEIARKMGAILQQQGLDVTVTDIAQENVRVTDYEAVILGSAVYIGNWMKPAAAFLKDHADALAQRPTWLFSSGPTGDGEPADIINGWYFPENLKDIAERIQPREYILFHGKLDNDDLNWLQRMMIKNVKAPLGDFRDWESIEHKAQDIAEALKTTA